MKRVPLRDGIGGWMTKVSKSNLPNSRLSRGRLFDGRSSLSNPFKETLPQAGVMFE